MSCDIDSLSPEDKADVLKFMEVGFDEGEAINLQKAKKSSERARSTVVLRPGVMVTLMAGPANIGAFRVHSVGRKFVILAL